MHNVKIIKADKNNKEQVLKLLDGFRNACLNIICNEENPNSISARDKGEDLFNEVVSSKNAKIFLAKDNEEYIGILTIYKQPQIRKGIYRAEIEEMFVIPEYQGKEVAEKLIQEAIKWCKEEKIEAIHLESHLKLERAHAFYKKSGFKINSKRFDLSIK